MFDCKVIYPKVTLHILHLLPYPADSCQSSQQLNLLPWPGVGPAWYFSPERRRGEAFNHLDDVWAAGCMMAELVIGQGARCRDVFF
jgi:serine/threonine protein kinase